MPCCAALVQHVTTSVFSTNTPERGSGSAWWRTTNEPGNVASVATNVALRRLMQRLAPGRDLASPCLEHLAHVDLKAAVVYCESASDFVSRQLFVDIMESEEEHIDWLETQLGLIEKVGLENYLQTAMNTVKPA